MEKQYYISKEQFETAKATWKSNQKTHSAWEHIIYNILRSKKPSTGFCEKTKAIQGNNLWHAYDNAFREAKWHCSPRGNVTLFKERFGIEMPQDLSDRLK